MPDQEIQLPSAGRIVHYYLKDNPNFSALNTNNAQFLPAIVTQTWDNLAINATVFIPGGDTVGIWSVPHQSESSEGSTLGYWVWPPRT